MAVKKSTATRKGQTQPEVLRAALAGWREIVGVFIRRRVRGLQAIPRHPSWDNNCARCGIKLTVNFGPRDVPSCDPCQSEVSAAETEYEKTYGHS